MGCETPTPSPSILSLIRPSWHLLFFELTCLRAFALAMTSAWNALLQVLAQLASLAHPRRGYEVSFGRHFL